MENGRNEPDDGLKSFAVWTKSDMENGRVLLDRVEPFDRARHYRSDMTGIVRAKDELGVYRFVESFNP